MSTNPRSTQYRSQTTQPPAPTPAREQATETAPRTFEPTNTGELPPMFETAADHDQR